MHTIGMALYFVFGLILTYIDNDVTNPGISHTSVSQVFATRCEYYPISFADQQDFALVRID